MSPGFFFMRPLKNIFFIVGPTATGKSELAAEVARECGAEIVSADAFQIYRGLDLLTAKPDQATMSKVPHHLIGAVSLGEEMNAAKFRALAEKEIYAVYDRGKPAIVVGGSGLYVKTLTHGLTPLPPANPNLRAKLNQLSVEQLHARLATLDSKTASTIDSKNRRRLERALEICLLSGKPASVVAAAVPSGRGERDQIFSRSAAETAAATSGVFVFRERDDLYDRINRRVEEMFANGVIEEVEALREIGPTAAQALGLHEIQQLIARKISEAECIGKVQQATRRYAKRQLTWFRHQTHFPSLNLSLHGRSEAIEWILREARLSFARKG